MKTEEVYEAYQAHRMLLYHGWNAHITRTPVRDARFRVAVHTDRTSYMRWVLPSELTETRTPRPARTA